MKNLFEDLEKLFVRSEVKENEIASAVLLMLSNGNEKKYNQLTSLTQDSYDYTQMQYAVLGNDQTQIKEYSDKFMWILRYGFCKGDEEKTKHMFNIITGKFPFDINKN